MPAMCTQHPRRGPQDRDRYSGCIHCRRERQRDYMRECRAARRKFRELEALIAS